ncbi:SGNH/GDSL hydrolase family protein [Pelomonas sp. CA6]|uniref:SGNH/GDSL hydrolase family protein n=1 Tax=Pelomonas sp. CA6 TaxID=2907999 RepID=UPI001F4BF050|nr:SGNH/GDSL hydrolase family protein [Pelomonas sp. CA6]MCH7343068.1 SGNH/GDSL hydrolase family protein [Pelomonas sp. CA6]
MKSMKRCLGLLLSVSALLTACGGSGTQIDPFKPTRIMAFGDELSVINNNGYKYTVNAVSDDVTPVLQCQNNPIWTQLLAAQFGLVFPQCNPSNATNPQGLILAQPGAKVDDVRKQIDNQLALNGVNSKDLITVFAGMNDVLELYGQFPSLGRESLIAEASTRGKTLAEQINRLARADGRVIFATSPDMGLSPFALKEKATHADTDRARLLTDLSQAFNVALKLNVINDGRMIGFVEFAEDMQLQALAPAYYGYSNISDASCKTDVVIPKCTNKTLVANATGASHMWATDLFFGPTLHNTLGATARSRAVNLPF